MSRYKFLKYCQQPNSIPPSIFDLVDARTFIKPDGRIPLVMLTEYGLYPAPSCFLRQEKLSYSNLSLLMHQVVGFIGRQYYSSCELIGIIEFFLDDASCNQILKRRLEMWNDIRFRNLPRYHSGSDSRYDALVNECFMLSYSDAVYSPVIKAKYFNDHGEIQVFKLHT